jgi:hypothetical protein
MLRRYGEKISQSKRLAILCYYLRHQAAGRSQRFLLGVFGRRNVRHVQLPRTVHVEYLAAGHLSEMVRRASWEYAKAGAT